MPRKEAAPKATEPKKPTLKISAPNWADAEFSVVGETPLLINRFSAKAQAIMHAKQARGDEPAKGKAKRDAKDFQTLYREAFYTSREGWHGINALSFRNAMISACRTANFKMTVAKVTLLVRPDGFDRHDGMPLVKIITGKPKYSEMPARNASGRFDLRPRPLWEKWGAKVRVRYDADQFKLQDVANLLMRAGIGGVGEGRNDSRDSNGLGLGSFTVTHAKATVYRRKGAAE